MVQLFVAQPTQTVSRRGTARFPFVVSGASAPVTYTADWADHRLVLERVVTAGVAGGELALQAAPGQRLPVGRHAVTFVATEAGTGNEARTALVVVVESCLDVGEIALTVLVDAVLVKVPVSSRCGPLDLTGDLTYRETRNGREITLSGGAGPASFDLTIPLGGRPFSEEDLQLSLRASDNTSVEWRPGHDPELTWTPPDVELPVPPPTGPRRRRQLAGAAAIGIAALIGLGLFATSNAEEAGPTPTTSAPSSSLPEPVPITVTTSTSGAPDPTTTTRGKLPTTGGQAVEVSVAASPAAPTVDDIVEVTVRARSADGEGTPGGRVDLTDGATWLGGSPLVDGQLVFRISDLAVGDHLLTVAYAGDERYEGSSRSVSLTIGRRASVVQITWTDDVCDITLRADVTGGSPSPSGEVVFSESGRELGRSPVIDGVATLATGEWGFGTFTFAAGYSGDERHLPAGDDTTTPYGCIK